MVEAIVAVALRALVAGTLLGGVLVFGVFVATRTLALTASTRHALWTMALVATAIMPLAGIGVSIARGLAAPPAIATSPRILEPAFVTTRSTGSASASHAQGAPAVTKDRTPASAAAPAASMPASVDRFAAARTLAAWRPRISRGAALAVLTVWLLGAAIGLVGLVTSIARVRGLKKRSSPLDGGLADELPWLTEAASGREIYLRLSYEIETPVAIGFRRPVILIPTELANADGLAAIESLVLHEHAHLRRYDDWTNLVQRTIERVFWFNPIIWLVGRRIALEREIASDDAVVEKTGAAHEYATSLWRLAREMRMPEHAVVAPGALLTRKQISVRIEQLLDKNRARLHRSPAAGTGVVLAGILAVAFVATSAPAVELPAATAVTPVTEHRFVIAAAPPVTADPLTDQKIAELEAQTESAPAPQKPQTVRTFERVVVERHAESPKKVAAAPDVAQIVVPPLPQAPNPPSGPSLAARASLPPIAAMPPAPLLPHAAPVLPKHVEMHLDGAAVTRLKQRIGTDITRTIQDTIASLPREIAQDSGDPEHVTPRLGNGVKLSRSVLASCRGCSLRNVDLRGVDLHGLTLIGDNLNGADLRNVNLAGARLTGVSLAGANLAGANLRGAVLSGVELRGANFDGAQLEDIKLTGVSLRHVSVQGTTLRSVVANCIGCDLSGMDLHGQDLHGVSLTGADLSRADLRDVNFSGAKLSGVNFSHANLAGANLTNASLSGCELSGVSLRGAQTTGMTLSGSSLDG